MKFGPTPLAEAEGAILAHALKTEGLVFKKGRRLSAEDLAALDERGIESVVAAVLGPEDLHEDEAADRLAAKLAGPGLTLGAAFTGRVNVTAGSAGILRIESELVERLNRIDEALTLATLEPLRRVEARQMVATLKIIPFAVPRALVGSWEVLLERSRHPALALAAFTPRQAALIQTTLPSLKPSLLDKMREIMDQRLAALGAPPIAQDLRVVHDTETLAQALSETTEGSADLVLIAGASAITDRRDVIPAALEAVGGKVRHFGMPVDPGNLILLGELADGRPAIGLPGCARSPKLNGFDWVLERLMADIPVAAEDIMAMGVGGLLKEIETRPLPRAQAVAEPTPGRAPRVAGLVLAAGRSTRMGTTNKLLLEHEGRPFVQRAVETVERSQVVGPPIVVTGHEAGRVAAALEHHRVTLAHNPDYARGLSTSLKRGLAEVPERADAVIVVLGDMPRIGPEVLDRLIAAFDPVEGRLIAVPTCRGKRGNPVLFATRFIPELMEIEGDVGAKALMARYAEAVVEVSVEDEAVLLDVDTPSAFARLA